jgi:hypothetical protein
MPSNQYVKRDISSMYGLEIILVIARFLLLSTVLPNLPFYRLVGAGILAKTINIPI